MNKTTADLPELARIAASDTVYRDHIFWSILTLHPDAFLRLVNGESMISCEGPFASASTAGDTPDDRFMVSPFEPPYRISDYDYRRLRKIYVNKSKVEAIKELRRMSGKGLKDAKDFIEATYGALTR